MNLRSILVALAAVSGFYSTTASAREVCGAPSGLNLRSGPSMHSRVKDTISNGDDFTKVLGDSSNGRWLQVRVGGQSGWVFRGYTCGAARTASLRSNDNNSDNTPGTGAIARFRNPIQGSCVSSDFGPRRRPRPGASAYHQGCDLSAGCGTPVRSTAPGRVVFAGRMGGYGNTIIVQHNNGTRSLYAHLSRINVRNGQRPTSDTVIGRVGTTGVSTGCHLHFGMTVNGRYVDPQRYIGRGGCPSYGTSSNSRWFRP